MVQKWNGKMIGWSTLLLGILFAMLLTLLVGSGTAYALTGMPTNEAFSYAGDEARVTWTAQSGAEGYKVYINGQLVAGNVTGTTYVPDTSKWRLDQLYGIRVTSFDSEGESYKSDDVFGWKKTSGAVRGMSSGSYHSVVLSNEGQIHPSSSYGLFNYGPTSLNNIVAISSASLNNVALLNNGTVI